MEPAPTTSESDGEIEGFLAQVSKRLEGQRLAPGTDVTRAVSAVLGVLAQRIGGGDAVQLGLALGHLVSGSSAKGEEADQSSRSFDFDGFLERVVERANVTEDTAHNIIGAVFGALRARLPRDAIRSIASRLPADILSVWHTPGSTPNGRRAEPELARSPSVPAGLRVSHPVLQRIEQGLELPPGMSGAAVFTVTMCLLMLRVTAELATQIRHALPDELSDLLFRCSQQREEEASRFGEAELLEVLASELGTSTEHAERIAAVVFSTMREALPAGDVERLGAQLPRGLKRLWGGGHAGRVHPG